MMEGVYLFHIMGVAPLLLYIAMKKPDWSESALVVAAVTVLAVHLRLLTADGHRGAIDVTSVAEREAREAACYP
jgi:hypothetical protein